MTERRVRCSAWLGVADITGDSAKHEECPSLDYSLNYIPAPFLNLLFFLPLTEAREGLSTPVWNYRVRKEIYDNPKWSHLLATLEARLKEIFPHSFLFQLAPSQIEYRNDEPRKVSLETLENLYHQIPLIDWQDQIEGGKRLARLAHEAWQRTQTPIPHRWLSEIGDDFSVRAEDRLRLTWLMDDGFLLPRETRATPNDPKLSDSGPGARL